MASLLERFYDPTAGMVMLDGWDLRSLDPSWLRGQVIGFISQVRRQDAFLTAGSAGSVSDPLLPSPPLLPHQVLLLSVLMVVPGPFPAFPPHSPLLRGWGLRPSSLAPQHSLGSGSPALGPALLLSSALASPGQELCFWIKVVQVGGGGMTVLSTPATPHSHS